MHYVRAAVELVEKRDGLKTYRMKSIMASRKPKRM